jgi:hypothetical protein
MRAGLLLVMFLAAGCSDIPEVDQYFTFNLTRPADFALPPAGVDNQSVVTVSLTNDTTDLAKHGTRSDLLRTAKVTRVQLQSGSSFNFAALSFARLLIGADTVADSLYQLNNEVLLHTTGKDITKDLSAAILPMTLQYAFQSPVTDTAKITATITIAITALPR